MLYLDNLKQKKNKQPLTSQTQSVVFFVPIPQKSSIVVKTSQPGSPPYCFLTDYSLRPKLPPAVIEGVTKPSRQRKIYLEKFLSSGKVLT